MSITEQDAVEVLGDIGSHPGLARVWLAVSQPFGLTCSNETGEIQSLKSYQQQPRLPGRLA